MLDREKAPLEEQRLLSNDQRISDEDYKELKGCFCWEGAD